MFGVPVVLSTVETKSFSGNTWPQVLAALGNPSPIERSSMNSWDDETFVAAVRKTGRKRYFVLSACGPRPASPCRPSRRSTLRQHPTVERLPKSDGRAQGRSNNQIIIKVRASPAQLIPTSVFLTMSQAHCSQLGYVGKPSSRAQA